MFVNGYGYGYGYDYGHDYGYGCDYGYDYGYGYGYDYLWLWKTKINKKHDWLVVAANPYEKYELGWWNSQLNGKIKDVPNHRPDDKNHTIGMVMND